MLAEKVNYGIERATIIALCLWGNWAIYYWVAVLVFDASYISLKAYIPVLAMQIVISLLYLLRTDLGFLNVNSRTSAFVKLSPRHITGTSFLMLAVSPTLLAVIVVFAADHFQWTNSALSYNLFWALMLPCSLAYLLYPKVFNGDSPAPAVDEGDRSSTLDCLLFLFGVSALAITVYGLGFPAWDEAFYGHVMSSMLANPALPVQGQDLLLDTSAPYSLHPSYRGVGYEVLIAWISDVMGLNPLQLYFDIFPVCGAILWSFAAYLFMRAVRVPYPGLAVTVSFLILLIWGGQGFSSDSVAFIWRGKSQVLLIAAPLLFFSVAAFIQQQTFRTWFLLLLSVCTVAILSSTALFVAPLTVGMAAIVFLPSIRHNLRTLFTIFLSLAPIFLLLAYGLLALPTVPVSSDIRYSGQLVTWGEEYGGLFAKSAVLMMLLLLPLIARTTKDALFQRTILRVCMVGIFTVMAPFFIEGIAIIARLNFLSFRLPASYPAVLLVGVMASIAVVHLRSTEPKSDIRGSRFLVPLFVLMLLGILAGTIQPSYVFGGNWRFSEAIFESSWREAEAARKLIPEGAYVAAGSLDDFLPILPDPPAFIAVRHYLYYHKKFLSNAEYLERNYLFTVLKNRLPEKSQSLETTMNSIVSIADNLGVTTIIFAPEPIEANVFYTPDPNKGKFVAALTARLTNVGYECTTTPSGVTIVCSRKEAILPHMPFPQAEIF